MITLTHMLALSFTHSCSEVETGEGGHIQMGSISHCLSSVILTNTITQSYPHLGQELMGQLTCLVSCRGEWDVVAWPGRKRGKAELTGVET